MLKYLRVIKNLYYNHQTGIVTNKDGKEMGYITEGKGRGYKQVCINKKIYMVHRLAWAIYYGEEPPKIIDHINGDGLDNSIINLRKSNHRQNGLNRKSHRDGRLTGAQYHKADKRWMSTITINKKKIYLGYFKTEKEAHCAYKQALKSIEINLKEFGA